MRSDRLSDDTSDRSLLSWVYSHGFLIALIATTLWISLIFFAGSPLHALVLGMPMAGLGVDDFARVSDLTAWWPLAADVSRGVLFPSAPALGQESWGIGFFPYLSVWLHGALLAVFGVSGTMWIGVLVLPVVAFILTVQIYRYFMPWRWSLFLAALGLVAFAGLPFRKFLFAVLTGTGWIEAGGLLQPDVLHFPFPALSLTIFLALFLLSIQRVKLTGRRALLLTLAWGLQLQVHVVTGILGVVFWALYSGLRLWRQEKNRLTASSVRIIAAQAAMLMVLALPSAASYLAAVRAGFVLFQSGPARPDLLWTVLIGYALLPVTLIVVLRRPFAIDLFELRSRFLPVWTLLLAELALMALNVLTGFGPTPELILTRLGLYFIHPFTFVPIIFYLTRPGMVLARTVDHPRLTLSLRRGLTWLFGAGSYVYLPLFFLFLTLFALASARQTMNDTASVRLPVANRAAAQAEAVAAGAPAGSTVAAQEPAANLLIPLNHRLGSLWVNRFANAVPEAEAIERLALYAHLMGWSGDRFAAFMAQPNHEFSHPASRLRLTADEVTPGFGYWLIHHTTILTPEQSKAYTEEIHHIFTHLDMVAALRRYRISQVLVSEDRLPASVPRRVKPVADGLLLTLDISDEPPP